MSWRGLSGVFWMASLINLARIPSLLRIMIHAISVKNLSNRSIVKIAAG